MSIRRNVYSMLGRGSLLLLIVLFFLTFWLYRQGFSAGFQFDDAPSISGVSLVHDMPSALAYLSDGRSGTLGRPLTLATFVLQKASWPDKPADFFMLNTLIHLFNGFLVFLVCCRLVKFFPAKPHQLQWFSFTVAAFWVTLPLHVSASLMAVQRMTTLASMFMLLGLVGYLQGRELLVKNPPGAYWVMSLSLIFGTLFAILCKENGVLLPLYVLVLEIFLLQALDKLTDARFRLWGLVFLGVPILLVLAYFAYHWSSITAGYALRNFTLQERLLTEPRILWEYLRHIYLPTRSGIGPYQDNYPISIGWFDPATTVVAIIGGVAVLVAALQLRKPYPWILFAMLWFLTGHLIESSFIPLELYFEHRNYLASLGPLLGLVALAWIAPLKLRRVVMASLIMMLLLRIFVLWQVTSLWGQPLLSAKLWAEERPQSVRAVLFLAGSYSDAGDQDAARQAILEGYARIPNDASLALHSVYSSCQHDKEQEFRERLEHIKPVLAREPLAKNVPILLKKMLEVQQQGGCPHLKLDDLYLLTDILLANPSYQALPGAMVDLHLLRNRLYALQGNADSSIREILTAFDLKHEYQIAAAAARALSNAGRQNDAIQFLDHAMKYAPRNPILRRRWEAEFENLKMSIEQSSATP